MLSKDYWSLFVHEYMLFYKILTNYPLFYRSQMNEVISKPDREGVKFWNRKDNILKQISVQTLIEASQFEVAEHAPDN